MSNGATFRVRIYDFDDDGSAVWRVTVGDSVEYVDLFVDSDVWAILAAAVNSHFEEGVKNV